MKMSIKKVTVALAGMMAAASVSQATLLTDSWTGSQAIPDGNSAGIANSLSLSDPGGALIQDVTVNFTISGGYNGDLYGYLLFQPTGGGARPRRKCCSTGLGPARATCSASRGPGLT